MASKRHEVLGLTIFECDECTQTMGSRPYYSLSDENHLCWDCAGPFLEPDNPKDGRRQLLKDAPEPPKVRLKRRVQHYETCLQHAVPCKDCNRGFFGIHEGGYELCCYYCCETCKKKCPDPVTGQVRKVV